MSNLYPVAGCKIFIGDEPIDLGDEDMDAADFEEVTWTEIDGFTQMGAYGDTAAEITTALINRGRDIRQKGTANAGNMECVFAQMDEDDGQIDLISAADPSDKNNYPFKIELNDTPSSGASPAPSERLFLALVMNATEQGGEANTIRNLASTLAINSNIVRVDATEGT